MLRVVTFRSPSGVFAVQRVTIREVAALAGVAVSTVSAVLNDTGDAKVASATRARVLEAVRVLGYEPHHAARALRGKSAGCLALIDDEVSTGPYGGQMLAGVQDVCGDLGIPVVSLSTHGDAERERDAVRYARSLGARAIVLASVSETVRPVPRPGTVVLLNGRTPADDVPGVVPDNEAGATGVVGELLYQGHRRIGVVTIASCEPADRRLAATRRALAAAGAAPPPDELVVRMALVEATAGGGREGARRLLALADPPTAILCFNDRMAMGVYQAVVEWGGRVPHDVSVVGYDNVEPVADSLDPGLTTVALPEREMGQLAAVLALDGTGLEAGRAEVSYAAEQLTWTGSTARIRCPLVLRGSVAPPRPAPSRQRAADR